MAGVGDLQQADLSTLTGNSEPGECQLSDHTHQLPCRLFSHDIEGRLVRRLLESEQVNPECSRPTSSHF